MNTHFERKRLIQELEEPGAKEFLGAAGVYVVWQGDQLIYATMSGKQIEKNRHMSK